jgi:hypothetical protein
MPFNQKKLDEVTETGQTKAQVPSEAPVVGQALKKKNPSLPQLPLPARR